MTAKLSRSREDYLKALYSLGRGGSPVSTSELAERLGVSAPSVTAMLRRLSDEALVDHAPRAGARLTKRGTTKALEMVRRHRILETFLVEVLGLDWSEVHGDAEVLEHHISDRVLEAIDRLVGHPEQDPHGHLIPDRSGRLPTRSLRPLADLERGVRATVREIPDVDQRRMARWKELHLVPGARVHMLDVRPADGAYELRVAGRSITLGREGILGILVEVPEAAGRPGKP